MKLRHYRFATLRNVHYSLQQLGAAISGGVWAFWTGCHDAGDLGAGPPMILLNLNRSAIRAPRHPNRKSGRRRNRLPAYLL
jgi:hypothetical protein